MESNKIFQKWLPLILLGLIGMFLSEFLIWNPLLQIIKGGIHLTGVGITRVLLMTSFMYIVLFAIGVDIIQRFKIKDAVSLLILGSIYGLILEGIFADSVFNSIGFGPKVLGVWLLHFSFTALSWHPFIDFLFGFFIFRLLLKGRLGFGEKVVRLKDWGILIGFGIFWFIWPYAKWYAKNLPQRIPFLALEAAQLFLPMVLIGIFLYLVFKRKTDYIPEKILGPKLYGLFVAFILLFTVRRFTLSSDKISLLFFCFVILLYVILLALYLKFGRKKAENSIYKESFPITGEFNIAKYVKLAAILFVFFFVFKYISGFLHLESFYLILAEVLAGLMILGGVVLPIFVIFKIIYSLLSGHAQRAKSEL